MIAALRQRLTAFDAARRPRRVASLRRRGFVAKAWLEHGSLVLKSAGAYALILFGIYLFYPEPSGLHGDVERLKSVVVAGFMIGTLFVAVAPYVIGVQIAGNEEMKGTRAILDRLPVDRRRLFGEMFGTGLLLWFVQFLLVAVIFEFARHWIVDPAGVAQAETKLSIPIAEFLHVALLFVVAAMLGGLLEGTFVRDTAVGIVSALAVVLAQGSFIVIALVVADTKATALAISVAYAFIVVHICCLRWRFSGSAEDSYVARLEAYFRRPEREETRKRAAPAAIAQSMPSANSASDHDVEASGAPATKRRAFPNPCARATRLSFWGAGGLGGALTIAGLWYWLLPISNHADSFDATFFLGCVRLAAIALAAFVGATALPPCERDATRFFLYTLPVSRWRLLRPRLWETACRGVLVGAWFFALALMALERSGTESLVLERSFVALAMLPLLTLSAAFLGLWFRMAHEMALSAAMSAWGIAAVWYFIAEASGQGLATWNILMGRDAYRYYIGWALGVAIILQLAAIYVAYCHSPLLEMSDRRRRAALFPAAVVLWLWGCFLLATDPVGFLHIFI